MKDEVTHTHGTITYTIKIGMETIQMSPVAVEWISTFLKELKEKRGGKKLKIIEFGSGISTLVLAQLRPDDEIVSIEENKEWYENVKSWLKEKNIKNVNLIFEEVLDRNYYIFDENTNTNYFHVAEQYRPFDLIINDGNMREYVGDSILDDIENWLTVGGLYLRHDYEMSFSHTWTGPHVVGSMDWINGTDFCYANFCATHPGYELLTINGNGKWGYKAELGGIWRSWFGPDGRIKIK